MEKKRHLRAKAFHLYLRFSFPPPGRKRNERLFQEAFKRTTQISNVPPNLAFFTPRNYLARLRREGSKLTTYSTYSLIPTTPGHPFEFSHSTKWERHFRGSDIEVGNVQTAPQTTNSLWVNARCKGRSTPNRRFQGYRNTKELFASKKFIFCQTSCLFGYRLCITRSSTSPPEVPFPLS